MSSGETLDWTESCEEPVAAQPLDRKRRPHHQVSDTLLGTRKVTVPESGGHHTGRAWA